MVVETTNGVYEVKASSPAAANKLLTSQFAY